MRRNLGRTYRKRNKKKDTPKEEYHENKHFTLMLNWMGKNAYAPAKKLKLKEFYESGRGLMTEEFIHPGDMILAIPRKLIITIDVVLKSEIGTFFKQYCPKASGHQMLSVFLLFEKSKGQSSVWYPYIETLPEIYNIPAFHGPQCLDMLPVFIRKRAAKQIKTMTDSYNQLNVIFKHLEDNFSFLLDNLDFELFKWAWCTVNTRCVFMDCFREDCIGDSCNFHMALTPFLDMLNHSPEVQVQAGFNEDTNQYEIISSCEFEKYSQVFINYGAHDNWTLLLEYGFVAQANCNDTVKFCIRDVVSAFYDCHFSSDSLCSKLKFIYQNNLGRNLVCSSDGLSWNLYTVLRILTICYDLRWWRSQLCRYLQFEGDDEENFKKLQTKLLCMKLEELKRNQVMIDNCDSSLSSLQLNISQLFAIANSILIKTMS